MIRRGFTVIELIIVVTIMAILIALGTVNIRNTQVSNRDVERKTDIETISQHLEIYYNTGTDDSPVATFEYPSTDLAANVSNMFSYLRDIDETVIEAPGVSDPAATLLAATCSGTCVQTTAGVTPQPTYNQYVYQPLQPTGSLCTDNSSQDCRKYNLYYRLESDNLVYMLTSKYQ